MKEMGNLSDYILLAEVESVAVHNGVRMVHAIAKQTFKGKPGLKAVDFAA